MTDDDTRQDGVATTETTDEGTDDSAGDESTSSEEETSAEEEKLYAGKYRSVEQLEAAYEEIQRFTGSRKELEEKAQAYDQLVARQARSAPASVTPPLLSNFVGSDGTIDVKGYDKARAQYDSYLMTVGSQAGNQSANEAVDTERAVRDFPYLATDKQAAKFVVSLYRSGGATSIYEAAKEYDASRREVTRSTEKKSTETAKHELSQKARGTTVSPSTRTDSGDVSPEVFARLSRADQKAYIEKQFKQAGWGNLNK